MGFGLLERHCIRCDPKYEHVRANEVTNTQQRRRTFRVQVFAFGFDFTQAIRVLFSIQSSRLSRFCLFLWCVWALSVFFWLFLYIVCVCVLSNDDCISRFVEPGDWKYAAKAHAHTIGQHFQWTRNFLDAWTRPWRARTVSQFFRAYFRTQVYTQVCSAASLLISFGVFMR